MLNLALKELELKAKSKGIKGYKDMSINTFLSMPYKSKQVEKS